jgi:hypothetical protein
MSAFGLNGMADRYETAPLYQSRFHESDMAWLADEYQKRSSREPSLTLEGFAAEYGVSADELRSHVPDLSRDVSHSIVLWHGTTKARAECILKEGFRIKKARNRLIFFTGKPKMARGIAQKRAAREGDDPAVLMCSIDLSHYSDFERRGNAVYAFRHICIGSEVVRKVEGLPKQRSEEQEKQKSVNAEVTDVALTFNAGPAAIAYWISSCMSLNGRDTIDENHETVRKIKQWLDAQLDAGRFGAVPDDEILEQVGKCLPQRSPQLLPQNTIVGG